MTAATIERPGIIAAIERGIRLSVPYGDLAAALDLMGTVCSRRPPVPMLGGALITVGHAGDAFIETFDYETHVRVLLDGGIRPGRILLNRQQLAFCLRTVLAGATRAKQARLPVEITTVGPNADFLVDGYRFSLPLMPVQDYPATPAYPDERVLTVSRDALLTEVNRLSVCAGKDQTLPQLTGINFTTVPGGLELAATDRFRLGIGYVPTVESGVEVNRLVPAKPLPTILKHLPGGPATVGFSDTGDAGQGWARFTAGPVSVSVRWLEQQFVKYRSLLPKERPLDVVVDRVALAVAAKRVASVTDRGHHLQATFADGTVTLSAGGPDDGTVTSPAIGIEQHGPDMPGPIAFNPAYLLVWHFALTAPTPWFVYRGRGRVDGRGDSARGCSSV